MVYMAASVLVASFVLISFISTADVLSVRLFYYYTDALLTIFLYFALPAFFPAFSAKCTPTICEAGSSAALVRHSAFLLCGGVPVPGKARDPLRWELSQNLYFVGLVSHHVLWGAF